MVVSYYSWRYRHSWIILLERKKCKSLDDIYIYTLQISYYLHLRIDAYFQCYCPLHFFPYTNTQSFEHVMPQFGTCCIVLNAFCAVYLYKKVVLFIPAWTHSVLSKTKKMSYLCSMYNLPLWPLCDNFVLPFQRKFTQRKLLYRFIVIRNIYDRHKKKYHAEETAYLLDIFTINFLNKSIVSLSKKQVISTKQILEIALLQVSILSQEEDIAVLFLFCC